MPPYFIVIAGPNGAGKSTTSKDILEPYDIQAFDWDQEFHKQWKTFAFDLTVMEGIRESTNTMFQLHLDQAFSKKLSIAYETNFHSAYNIDLAKKAKSLGYQTVLYFLALNNPEIAIKRVEERVRKGGHSVSESTIRERFTKGLEMLDENALQFYDRIAVYNSSERFELQFVIQNKKLEFTKSLDPDIVKLLPTMRALLGL
ncbi:MAG: zeta toxin family protein [Cyclobacteriaceae bacterium]